MRGRGSPRSERPKPGNRRAAGVPLPRTQSGPEWGDATVIEGRSGAFLLDREGGRTAIRPLEHSLSLPGLGIFAVPNGGGEAELLVKVREWQLKVPRRTVFTRELELPKDSETVRVIVSVLPHEVYVQARGADRQCLGCARLPWDSVRME